MRNISSDTFEGVITPKSYKPSFTLQEALEITLKPYSDGLAIPREDVERIKEVLINFYKEMLLMY